MLSCIIKTKSENVERGSGMTQRYVKDMDEAIKGYFLPTDMEYKCPVCKHKGTRMEKKFLFTVPK